MPSRSQRHLRELRGVDSGGNVNEPPFFVQVAHFSEQLITVLFSIEFNYTTGTPAEFDYLKGFTFYTNDGLARSVSQPADTFFSDGITAKGFFAEFTPQSPFLDFSTTATLSYDSSIGTLTSAGGQKLQSFSNMEMTNLVSEIIVPQEPFVEWGAHSGGPAPAPWVKATGYSTLAHANVLVIGNSRVLQPDTVNLSDPGRKSEFFDLGSGKTWAVAAAEYYCTQRGIPLSNILYFDLGESSMQWRKGNNPPAPDFTYWRNTFCPAVVAKLDAMEAAGNKCKAVLMAPGTPFMVETSPNGPTSVVGDTSLVLACLPLIAAYSRFIVSSDWQVGGSTILYGTPQVFAPDGQGGYNTTPVSVGANIPLALTGDTNAPNLSMRGYARVVHLGVDRLLGTAAAYPTPAATALLGNSANVALPTGRIGYASGYIAIMQGSASAVDPLPYPGLNIREIEQMAKELIDSASVAFNLSDTAHFNLSRSEPILAHLHESYTNMRGPENNALMAASLSQWGFTDVRYYYRRPQDSSLRPAAEAILPIANQTYFVDKDDYIGGGFYHDAALTNRVVGVEIATQFGGVRNHDHFTSNFSDAWTLPASGYSGLVTSMAPSNGHYQGRAMSTKGGFSWMEPVFHKGGGDDIGAQYQILHNTLQGLTLAEAHYYGNENHKGIDIVCGDPLWRPFPLPPP